MGIIVLAIRFAVLHPYCIINPTHVLYSKQIPTHCTVGVLDLSACVCLQMIAKGNLRFLEVSPIQYFPILPILYGCNSCEEKKALVLAQQHVKSILHF